MPTADESNEWYTVCSKPHSNYILFVAIVGIMAVVGIVAYRFCFAPPTNQKMSEKSKKKRQ